jgi:anti-anti-sigma factor
MDVQQATGGAVLALNGEFDLSQRDRVKDAFETIVAEPVVVVDLAKTAYIDSTILGSLLRLRGDVLRNGGSFALAAPSVMVQRLLDITMLTQLFDVRESVDGVDGIAGFRRIELISDES